MSTRTTDLKALQAELRAIGENRTGREPLETIYKNADRERELISEIRAIQDEQAESHFKVSNHGSIFLVFPTTGNALEHLEENVGAEAQWFGPSLVVEHRYIADLVNSLRANGWRVS